MAGTKIKDESSLRGWLNAIPDADRRINASAEISIRAALRVVPLLLLTDATNQRYLGEEAALATFRRLLVAWAVARFPGRRIELRETTEASGMAAPNRFPAHSASYSLNPTTSHAAKSVGDAFWNAQHAAANRLDLSSVNSALEFAALAHAQRPYPDLWEEFRADARAIGKLGDGSCLNRPLWTEMPLPTLGSQSYDDFPLPLENGWGVWQDWYKSVSLGETPWPESAVMTIAQLSNEDWRQSPAIVNTKIKDILSRPSPSETTARAIELKTGKDIEHWLNLIPDKNQRRRASIEIAVRSALRVAPLSSREPRRGFGFFDLWPVLCIIATPWVAARFPARLSALRSAAERAAGGSNSASGGAYARLAAAKSAYTSSETSVDVEQSAASAVLRAVSAILARSDSFDTTVASTEFWEALSQDATAIGSQGLGTSLNARLWEDESQISSHLFKFGQSFPPGEDWDVWFDWYEKVSLGQSPWPEAAAVEIVTLPDADWKAGPAVVNRKIKEILARHYVSSPISSKQSDDTELAVLNAEVEPQNDVAILFGGDESKLIDVLSRVGADRVSRSQDNRDSHAEVSRFANELIRLHENAATSPNNGNALAYEDTKHLLEAHGETLEDLRPGLLIPRGEALRQLLARQDVRDDFSDVPPLTDKMRDALAKLVRCYNGFVALDAELARRDDAQLGPDALRVLVPPEEGTRLADEAVEQGAATQAVADAVRSEAANAPRVPEPSNRVSRRLSESVKNLWRALLRRAHSFIRISKAIGDRAKWPVGALGIAAKLTIQYEAWLLRTFADSPAMLNTIKAILEVLKTIPLLG